MTILQQSHNFTEHHSTLNQYVNIHRHLVRQCAQPAGKYICTYNTVDFDFEKCLLHGPISINIPDNKATKYPQTRGYLHQKRRGWEYVHKKHRGDGTAQKLYFLCFWIPCKWRPLHSSTSILADFFIIIYVVQNKHFIIYVSAPTPLNVKLTWLFDKV